MELKKYIVDHKIDEHPGKLAKSCYDDGPAEELNQAIIHGMLLAGSKCETAKCLL
jgi:hypothetical protein